MLPFLLNHQHQQLWWHMASQRNRKHIVFNKKQNIAEQKDVIVLAHNSNVYMGFGYFVQILFSFCAAPFCVCFIVKA